MMCSFKINKIRMAMMVAFLGMTHSALAIEFNTDVLDVSDKENINFSNFSEANYIMPGTYTMMVRVNGHNIAEHPVKYIASGEKEQSTQACITPKIVETFGLKPEALAKVRYTAGGQCADFSQLEGTTVRGNLANSSLEITIPQAWLEYSDENWVPYSQWDNGIPGLLLDYNVNSTVTKPSKRQQTQNTSVSGTVGMNAGAWRLRGDYQGNYTHTTGSTQSSTRNFDWSRIYAYRAIPQIHSTVTLGENYLTSGIFDSWRYNGVSLATDDRMLPPALRGYAPEVAGIAKTNAKVTIKQQGRVIYESTVAAGPFRIQELNSAVNGKLDVEVLEQDGSVQRFQVDTATIPYLTRPGMVQYKIAAGRPSDYQHHVEGPLFTTGEFSWGIANSWSLYGGSIIAGDYNALSIGLGRDLYMFGAVSADVTQSYARLPGENRQGKSWRLSYSKRFDELDSEVTFAGYRFSERDYLSMSEYLDTRYSDGTVGQDKELYTITASKNFADLGLSAYLSYSHQTYWDQPADDRFSISASTYFDVGQVKDISLNLSAQRSKYNGRNDDAVYLSLSVPLGDASLGFNSQYAGDRMTNNTSYYDRLDENNNYRVSAGLESGGDQSSNSQFSGYYSHRGDIADITANASYSEGNYTSMGLSAQGGATVTTKGAALHSGGYNGATRLMVDTDGVANVPVDSGHVHTNAFGIGVVSSVNSYYRNNTSITLDEMDDNVEASKSVVESTLTEGAIGYRKFGVIKGAKALAILSLADGSRPPFGATVTNKDGRELAIVGDDGVAWLTGLQPNEKLDVNWNGATQCQATVPQKIDPQAQLLLPCTASFRTAGKP